MYLISVIILNAENIKWFLFSCASYECKNSYYDNTYPQADTFLVVAAAYKSQENTNVGSLIDTSIMGCLNVILNDERIDDDGKNGEKQE